MKKSVFLTTMFCLLAISAFAQDKKTKDFSGSWTLDVSKSKLDERVRIESMTLNVSQTEKELKIETATKRAPRTEGEMPNGGMRRGGGGGRMGGGDGTTVYSLDGKETTSPLSGGQSGGTAAMKAEFNNDKLKLTSTRKISSPMGDFTLITKETWEILDGGKSLKIVRESETPRGNVSSQMIFTKK
ncbi:MAG: hypothetical protein H0U50_05250 [Pyrinomonadaceae bacterium]|nr:hypothetical protein [Pyrinomonadaceae bacterium]